ncbi:MAG TPA: [acyl-carrier-protein] S-malonyltransferase [Candidatus Tenderia electrophaga]|uniref:Malonyl CoA-acyl carrier protein transacylase n=1 Tax=Candidatus Tenderia electrophaga TaxID=1748243 RepID=A0A832N748_9GAMM|nr:[acyl-carrier-protein] S-malonyltransferase [Candidatus Tenderia electrophaga]
MSLAFVFPGQGSQSVGMLKDLAAEFAEVEATFKQASDALGYDLWEVVQNGPAEKLNQTDITQPAMLSAGVAVWRIWQARGGAQPVMMAGHSLGEYTALVCAGALDFRDAVKLVAERGRLMQQAVPAGEGAMAAILGLDDDAVIQVCTDAAEGEVLSAVNFNSPGQVVIAGQKSAVERALVVAKEKGAKRALLLPVSVPSHCALMKPAAEKLAKILADMEIRKPAIPVINNVDVQAQNSADEIRAALVKQLHNPVRWVEIIQAMAADGVDSLIVCGPGKVLAGLNKRIERGMSVQAVFNPDTLGSALQS